MSIVIPENITFNSWLSSLLVDFNTGQVIIKVPTEENWREVCDQIAASPIFSARGAPLTSGFSNWKEWAIMITNTF